MEGYNISLMKQQANNVIVNIQKIETSTKTNIAAREITEFKITFKFYLDSVFSLWILKQDCPQPIQLLRSITEPTRQSSAVLNLDEFSSDEKARHVIGQKVLDGWINVPADLSGHCIDMAMDIARTVVKHMPTTHNNVCVYLHAVVTFKFYFDERLSGQIHDFIKNTDCKTCSICLEGFDDDDDSEFVILPCVHKFHRHCIKTWQAIRGSCPVCRLKINTII